MASPTLLTPTTTKPTPPPIKPKLTVKAAATLPTSNPTHHAFRRHFLSLAIATATTIISPTLSPPSAAAADEDYVKETEEVITKLKTTISMDRNDPNVADAVASLREASNFWVAKYRKEKALLSKISFRDMYSALNAVSGHYISFGPTAPIPAKRKARILEEMDSVQKALSRGR